MAVDHLVARSEATSSRRTPTRMLDQGPVIPRRHSVAVLVLCFCNSDLAVALLLSGLEAHVPGPPSGWRARLAALTGVGSLRMWPHERVDYFLSDSAPIREMSGYRAFACCLLADRIPSSPVGPSFNCLLTPLLVQGTSGHVAAVPG